jgi:Ca2+-binding EF-hand superfamily protein
VIPAALLLTALLTSADPADVHDVLLEVNDGPAVRLRLRIELDDKPLARLEVAARQARQAIEGKPGVSALDRIVPLLRAEAMLAVSPQPAALTRAIASVLDKNGDGVLSADELLDAERLLLRKFDLDDDECLTALELLPDLQTVVPKGPASTIKSVRVTVVPVEGKAAIEQTVKVGRKGSFWRGKVGGVWIELYGRPGLPSEKPSLPKSLLVPGREEVKAAFERLAPGVVSLTAVPGPVSWFDRLDTDHDGQLSVAELRQAKAILTGAAINDTGVSLILVPGLAAPPAVPFIRTFTREAGPAWFRAMDRNGDGYVSPREFLGTPEQFRKIDTNGDGLISPEEAAAATPEGKP